MLLLRASLPAPLNVFVHLTQGALRGYRFVVSLRVLRGHSLVVAGMIFFDNCYYR